METQRVLIIEDVESLSHALELKLMHEGFAVEAVPDGEVGVKLLQKERFDLLILDLIMPQMDGFQVLEFLNKKDISLPVVVLTTLSQQEDKDKATSMGATYFFVKSEVSIASIVEHVKNVLTEPEPSITP